VQCYLIVARLWLQAASNLPHGDVLSVGAGEGGEGGGKGERNPMGGGAYVGMSSACNERDETASEGNPGNLG